MIAQHVDERHCADNSIVEIRALHHGGGDQQPTIAATGDAQVCGAGESTFNDVFCYRNKIVEYALAVLQQSSLVPLRTVFSTTADIGQHISAALL